MVPVGTDHETILVAGVRLGAVRVFPYGVRAFPNLPIGKLVRSWAHHLGKGEVGEVRVGGLELRVEPSVLLRMGTV